MTAAPPDTQELPVIAAALVVRYQHHVMGWPRGVWTQAVDARLVVIRVTDFYRDDMLRGRGA